MTLRISFIICISVKLLFVGAELLIQSDCFQRVTILITYRFNTTNSLNTIDLKKCIILHKQYFTPLLFKKKLYKTTF